MKTVAVLFARLDSVYKAIQGCDVWDIERDARKWQGGSPVVAHPPCRAWGRLRQFAKPGPDEKYLAFLAVRHVREFGGVLEHPESSTLWREAELPLPGAAADRFGGWTLVVDQYWWGHPARKRTWLYIVGVGARDLPVYPLRLGKADKVIGSSVNWKGREVPREWREKTPPELALWLVDLAARCKVC